ncbi:Tc5 transposase DNA-binding domain-containing protein [Hirsutella rhossiliensis]|uniref:Tc5 transposase DNA-binding domain-containing protein n=1 Tax=Hirsutella rhossiliensis TaxID=111463 RepID=A0A9P8SJH4_9HYPO|nr:tc5 transposase DNA-binding domain-containing protein [Hirsutella rhossiliensis]KAH0965313.1 tc5 transposase DNA-binding domain-containing protein [Hirsutella rhossiliensis]
MTPNDNALAAARDVIASRRPPRAALRRATTPQRTPLSIRKAAPRYKVNRGAVERAIRSLENPFARGQGRPTALTEDEDNALVAYIQWMERTGIPAGKEQLEAAANTIRQRRDPSSRPMSQNWLAGWRQSHPEVKKTYLKAVERARVTHRISASNSLTPYSHSPFPHFPTETSRRHHQRISGFQMIRSDASIHYHSLPFSYSGSL